MGHFGWIHTSLLVIKVLLFTAEPGRSQPWFTAAAGDDITLPCGNVMENLHKCDSTSWIFTHYNGIQAKELVTHGNISKNGIPKDKSERLSVTENCDLVIKRVTSEDYGRYTCRQFVSGQQVGEDSQVHLSVISVRVEDQSNDKVVVLFCSSLSYEGCGHTVTWLYEGDMNNLDIKQGSCSATATILIDCQSKHCGTLTCNVTAKNGQVKLVRLQYPYKKTESTSDGKNWESPEDQNREKTRWWWFIVGVVGSAALLITAVVLVLWKITKRSKTQTDENIGQRLNSAVTHPDTDTSEDVVDPVDPGDGLLYAAVSYSRKADGAVQAVDKEGSDEADAVTYSPVKAPPPSACGDSSSLYATVSEASKNEVAV